MVIFIIEALILKASYYGGIESMNGLSRMLVLLVFSVLCAIFGLIIYTTYKVHTRNRKISASAETVNTFLRIIKPKYFLKWIFEHPPRSSSPLRASRKFSEKYDLSYHSIQGDELMTVKPRGGVSDIHIVYLHGGAFVLGKNGVKGSESFISSFIEGTGAKMTFIDYPVAPESRFTATLKSVYAMYLYLNEEYKDDDFILMGDSAGGGLALSFSQMIAGDSKVRSPKKIVSFSPWLDLSMDTPGIDDLGKVDMILSKQVLLYAAELYAGSDDSMSPLVSPIYGDFSGLGETMMFFGSFELFYADGLKMREMAEANNFDIRFRFYPEMPHDWVILPIVEAGAARREAFDFILK